MNPKFLDNLEEAVIQTDADVKTSFVELSYESAPITREVDSVLLKLASELLSSVIRGSLRSVQYECTDLISRAAILLAEERKALA